VGGMGISPRRAVHDHRPRHRQLIVDCREVWRWSDGDQFCNEGETATIEDGKIHVIRSLECPTSINSAPPTAISKPIGPKRQGSYSPESIQFIGRVLSKTGPFRAVSLVASG